MADPTFWQLTRFSRFFTDQYELRLPSLTKHQPKRRNLGAETQVSGDTGISDMTTIRVSALAACLFASISLANAETRTFVLDSSDGYGIDTCLMKGEACGKAMAAAVCQANQYASVIDFGRMDPTEITGSAPGGVKGNLCGGKPCPEKVAITCTR